MKRFLNRNAIERDNKTKEEKIMKVCNRVARWFIFKPKILIWVNFGGPWNGKYWYIL
jgi:hypothetical protein